MKKSILALLLCAALCTGLLCGAAMASGDVEEAAARDLQEMLKFLDLDPQDSDSDGSDIMDNSGGGDKILPAGSAGGSGDEDSYAADPTATPAPTATPVPTATPEPVPIKKIAFQTPQGIKISVYEKPNLARQLVLEPAGATAAGLTWEVSGNSGATISDSGVLTPSKAGNATVTVKDPASGKSAKLRVTISQPVLLIKVSDTSLTVFKGKNTRLTAEVVPEDASNKKLKWTSDNPNVAKVSGNGTVTGVNVGSTTIRCEASDGSGVEKTIRVTVNAAVKKITFASKGMTLVEGKTGAASWNVEPTDATNKNVSWTSSNSAIASVDSYGNVAAKSVGSCTITATAKDGSGTTAQFTVYVEPKVPVYVDYLWWQTRYYAKTGHFAVDVISNCVNRKIRGFTCEVKCYVSKNSTPQTSSHFFSGRTVNPGKRVKTEWSYYTAPGLTTASIVELKVTDVYFSDGTFYMIPSYLQETITFNMNSY